MQRPKFARSDLSLAGLENMKRRPFIVSALATTIAGRWIVNSNLTNAAESPVRRVRIGFLGASHSHASEKVKFTRASPEYELVGICEDDESVRKQYQSLGVPLVSQEKLFSDAEVIAVESAVRDHARHGRLALEAGKHVHLEKPPADTYAEFQKLVTLAREKKRLLQMGYMWRFHPGINAALEAARQGWLGQVYLVRGTINTTVDAVRRPEWAEFHGGTLFELGSHLIDPVVRLQGRPAKVTSFLKNHGGANDTLADNTVAVFEYPKALAIVSSATLQPGAGAHRFFEIQGSNGTALVKPIEPPKLQIDLAKAAGPYAKGIQSVPMPDYRRYAPELTELARCVRSGQPLSVTPEEDLLVQETLLRACEMLR
ncbi:MAG: Gfo/Idh/MocA family oxidoreductase [Verrucomicrobia bacterium]|nr:Gfo/Idh/MocA family oxidoreductase [Verrucomicrobiota bacterium]